MVERRRQGNEDGYTLAELVVVVALLLVVLIPILMTLQSSTRGSDDLRRNTDARAQTRTAIDLLTRDFRQAQTGDPNLAAVSAINGSSITFYSPDKSEPPRLRKITYAIAGGNLTRSVQESANSGVPWVFTGPSPSPTIAIENIKAGSGFSGFDASGGATTDPSIVRRLDVTLIVNGVPRPGASQTFTQSIQIRTEY